MKRVFSTCHCQNCKTKFRENVDYRRQAEVAIVDAINFHGLDKLDLGEVTSIYREIGDHAFRIINDLSDFNQDTNYYHIQIEV